MHRILFAVATERTRRFQRAFGQEVAEQGYARFDWALKANVDYMRRLTRT